MDPSLTLDCAIIGGGPAGLTAAIYLARFRLEVVVLDAGASRVALIPLACNHAGFPEGISGRALLARMQQQAARYGATLQNAEVEQLARDGDGFVVRLQSLTLRARSVLLATGVVNRRPEMMDAACHDEALASGRLRYCPICDGYEVTDKDVAVLGTGERGYDEAIFLRGFTRTVTLAAPGAEHDLSDEQRRSLAKARIVLAGQCTAIRLPDKGIALTLPSGERRFDTLYPALGSDIRSGLAKQVGAALSDDGCLTVDAHQRTDVAGLYAAGDVVLGLDQISHAMGEGGVAATTIRNDLARSIPLFR